MDIKERMANVGMTQVDMILELQKRGYAVQPPMMSSILRGVYTYPNEMYTITLANVALIVKGKRTYASVPAVLKEQVKEMLIDLELEDLITE